MRYPSNAADVSAPIEVPDFLVGQDGEGYWIAVETHGLGGGIFATRDAALNYARAETSRRAGAVHLAPALLTLR